jgi:hypothetical protein
LLHDIHQTGFFIIILKSANLNKNKMPPSYNTRSSTAAAATTTAPTGTVDDSPTDTSVAKPPPPPPPKVQPETPVGDETVPVPPLPPDTAEAMKGTIFPIVTDVYEVPQPEFATDMGAATVNPEVNCYFAPHVLVNPTTDVTASTSPPHPHLNIITLLLLLL